MDLPLSEEKKFEEPLDIILQKANSFSKHKWWSSRLGKQVLSIALKETVPIEAGCRDCTLIFSNERTKKSFLVTDVIHWAWKGNLLLVVSDAPTSELNQLFLHGDRLLAEYNDLGKRKEDNLALTFVHGNVDNEKFWQPTRLRYGRADSKRLYMPFTVNPRAIVRPGETFVARQYMISGSFLASNKVPYEWVNETYYDVLSSRDEGSISTTIQLYLSNDRNYFDFTTGNQTCIHGSLWCNGSSLPGHGKKAFFHINCGNSSIVGSDLYAFSETSGSKKILRPYAVCYDDKRPKWDLLGFFNESCPSLFLSHNNKFCAEKDNSNVSSKPLLSSKLSASPSLYPSHVLSRRRTWAPSFTHSNDQSAVSHSLRPLLSSSTPSIDPTILNTSLTVFPSTALTTHSMIPSSLPNTIPSYMPSSIVSAVQSIIPNTVPNSQPSLIVKMASSSQPSSADSVSSSVVPSSTSKYIPSAKPRSHPVSIPSAIPSEAPSILPPSMIPSSLPSITRVISTDNKFKKNRKSICNPSKTIAFYNKTKNSKCKTLCRSLSKCTSFQVGKNKCFLFQGKVNAISKGNMFKRYRCYIFKDSKL